MSVLLLGLLPKIVLGITVLAGLAGTYFMVRGSGRRSQQAEDTRRTLSQVEARDAASDEVARESDATVADDLRRQRGG